MDNLIRGFRSPFSWFLLALLTTAGLTAIGPEQAAVGEQVRIVYLRGAWELAAEVIIGLAAAAGFFGLLFRRLKLQRWSAALGRTGIIFWLITLPLAMWALQTDWNGIFPSEARFRLAFIFAAAGALLQIGMALLAQHAYTSLANVLFFCALWITFHRVEAGLTRTYPPSLNPGMPALQLYFVGLVFLTLAAAYFLTRWWLQKTP